MTTTPVRPASGFTLEDYSDRVAVVTGAASGIGRGIAEALVERGARVVISDIDADALETSAAEIGAEGVRVDVTDADAVAELASDVRNRYGRIDIVINNAGVGSMGRIQDLTLADWRWMLDVNLFGVINGIHAFLPYLLSNRDGGYLVNTASMAGLTVAPGLDQAAYAAGKMGVVGITEFLANELRADGARVGTSVLCPGPVRSRISEGLRSRTEGATGGLYDTDASANGPLAAMRWMEPRAVGDLVAEAMITGELYIITHAELWPAVEARFDAIHDAFTRAGE